ncbi:substrate-binding domain-containing protein, partial [Streptosporangium fragile]|uniref:substrate-binding domain-containing protein n=1 Tax=Streptosporangium fragile TaxID=46186 RepID=UPI0031EFCBB4
ESYADRLRGFREAAAALGVEDRRVPVGGRSPEKIIEELAGARATAVFLEEPADAAVVVHAARERGLVVPRDLSILALGAPTRPVRVDLDVTGFHIPRREMGRRAVELLVELLEKGGTPQELLPCTPVEGATLAPAGG